jgi:hypothetical protein
MLSELGLGGIIVVLCTSVFAISWILLPFLVSAVQRSTSNCSRELRALNRRMDLIMNKLFFESRELKDALLTASEEMDIRSVPAKNRLKAACL